MTGAYIKEPVPHLIPCMAGSKKTLNDKIFKNLINMVETVHEV